MWRQRIFEGKAANGIRNERGSCAGKNSVSEQCLTHTVKHHRPRRQRQIPRKYKQMRANHRMRRFMVNKWSILDDQCCPSPLPNVMS